MFPPNDNDCKLIFFIYNKADIGKLLSINSNLIRLLFKN